MDSALLQLRRNGRRQDAEKARNERQGQEEAFLNHMFSSGRPPDKTVFASPDAAAG